MREFWLGRVPRVRLEGFAAVSDAAGTEVCRGSFRWSLSRAQARARPGTGAPVLHVVA